MGGVITVMGPLHRLHSKCDAEVARGCGWCGPPTAEPGGDGVTSGGIPTTLMPLMCRSGERTAGAGTAAIGAKGFLKRTQ